MEKEEIKKAIMEIKIKNWRIKFKESRTSGWLIYEGKSIPRWGGGMSFIMDKYSVRYDYPEVVPEYVDKKLEAIRENIYVLAK